MIKQWVLKYEGLFLFHSIFIFSAKPCFSTQAVNNARARKCGELPFSSSSPLCKTMVSRICKTIGKVTGFYDSSETPRALLASDVIEVADKDVSHYTACFHLVAHPVWFTDIVGGSVYRHRMTPQKREDDLKKDQPL